MMTCRSPEHPIRSLSAPKADVRKSSVRSSTSAVVRTADAEAWARYDAWTRAVGEEFFDGRFAGRPVYLDLEPAVVASLAARAGESGGAERSLIEAVSETLNLPGADDPLLAAHHVRLSQWRKHQSDTYPPVLGVLAFFSAVAESMAAEDGLAANNYYGRCCELLGLDQHDEDNRTWMFRGFSKHAAEMWQALNTWLEEHEGERGLPTAYAFDHRVLIGPAVSQALVKETDRKKLPQMFRAYGLPAGYSVSLSDSERLLKEWLPSSNLSSSLKKAFKRNAEARRRIAGVARLELEAWDGLSTRQSSENGGPAAATPLRLLAVVRKFLGARLEFGLAVRDSYAAHERELRVADDAEIGPSSLVFVNNGDGWVRLADNSAVRWPDLMTRPVTLTDVGGAQMTRKASRVVVLRHEATLAAYVEADRAPLGDDCMVLAHSATVDAVEAMLAAAARPGFTRADDLRGVPVGWTLFTDVQILASVDAPSLDLQPLVPVSWTQLVLADGFSLPGRTRKWHRRKPPEVRVSAQTVEQGLVSLTSVMSGDGVEAVDVTLGTVRNAAVFSLTGLDLDAGDYEVKLETSGKKAVLAQATLRLRDGSHPAAEDVATTDCIVRPLNPEGPLIWLTGDRRPPAEIEDLAHMNGADVRGAPQLALKGTVPLPERPAWTAPGGRTRAQDFEEVVQPETPVRPPGDSCVVTGAHHFVLPTYTGKAKGPTVSGRCKYCGLTEWWPSRPPKQGETADDRSGPIVDLSAVPPIEREDAVDWELLLDGLAHVRHGSWGQFERLARQGEDHALFIQDLGKTLEALGHLEIERDPATLDPLGWQVTPTTFYDRADGLLVVSGLRPLALSEHLEQLGSELGGTVRHEDNGDAGPATILVEGVQAGDVPGFVSRLEVRSGLPVRHSLSPATTLLASLPNLWDIAGALPRRPLPSGSELQWFDGVSGRWVACDEPVEAGAYRIRAGRQRYFIRTAQDVVEGYVRYADPFTVKHAGTILSNHPLLAFQSSDSSLLTPLGAELPGLYERAAVLCSGRPPQKLKSGLTRYLDVPREHAEALAARLFTLPEAS